jgi:D-arabinose 1-dehydrogenase-like Zn-dependent alcohol dehydrogenase
MQIRAYVIREKGSAAEPFLYERTRGGHDVLVRITHRSLARGDIQFIDNDWGDARYPLVPGHEIIGIVEGAGSEVGDLHTGDRVEALHRGYRRGHAARTSERSHRAGQEKRCRDGSRAGELGSPSR